MKETLEKCPLCGAKVVDAYNSVTKQFYYKCTNSACHFRLPKNYTEQEVSLQGIELDAVCSGCGNPLTIACGPNSLYATCLRCTYDTTPNMVNGFVFRKHANAHNIEAQEEIKNLIKEYKGIIDEDYSFDDFLEDSIEEISEVTESSDEKEENIFANINKEEFIYCYNKGYSINQLSQKFNVSRSQIRCVKKYLLNKGIIETYVNKKHPKASVETLENIIEETAEEVVTEISKNNKKKQKAIRIAPIPRKGSALEIIVNLLKTNPERKFDAQTIKEETGIEYSTICNYLTQLRKTGVIKIVGYTGDHNPLVISYAITESPLPKLPLVEDEDKYITTNSFFKKYSKKIKKVNIQSTTFLNNFVEKKNLNSYYILTKQGLRKCYLKDELLNLFEDKPKEEKEEHRKEMVNKSKIKSYLKIGDKIINFLSKNMDKGYTIGGIAKTLGINDVSIASSLKILRKNGKAKVVGNENTRILYQVTESPLPALKIASNEEYLTPYNFFQQNKDIVSSLESLKNKIREANLEPQKIFTRRGIGIGYRIKEMRELYKLKSNTKESLNTVINCTTKESMNDRSLEHTHEHKNSFLGFMSSLFSTKENLQESEDLETISF